MVNIAGMHRISTYEEVMREIELDKFKVKAPDRLATFILEAPEMISLDPENEEEIIEFEKRKRAERARRDEVEEVAQQRGVSRAQLELLTRQPRQQILDQRDDGFETRRLENQMAMDVQVYDAAAARAENVERIRGILRQQLASANRSDPLVRLADEDTVFHDISTPPDVDPGNLPTPSVPRGTIRTVRNLASAGLSAASFGADMIENVGPPTVDLIAEAARLTARYGPTMARSTLRAAGVGAQGLGLIARGSGHAVAGLASASANVLASTIPANHRGRDFQLANGVSFVGHVVQGHAHSMF